MDGSEWQLALGLLSWMDANRSEWQFALGLLNGTAANGSEWQRVRAGDLVPTG